MTMIRPAALDWLEATATETALAERECREKYLREIERLEMERRRAFRRFNFLAALVAVDANAVDREASQSAQRAAARDELGWERDESDALDAMTALADAVHDERLLATAEAEAQTQTEDDPVAVEPVAIPSPVETPADARAAAILFALSAFEERFEAIRGKPFAAEFDRTFPETPLVDF